jgi:monoamine oxidase
MLETLIVGAGLCGLSIASRLQSAGRDFIVVEARRRPGGRIETTGGGPGDVAIDLGPGWFWPDTQPRMVRLLAELGLQGFPQHDSGDILHLAGADASPEVLAQPGVHNGAHRVAGGMVSIIDALVRRLAPDVLRTGCELVRLIRRGDHIEAHCRSAGEALVIAARNVVLAMPPRLVAERIAFDPVLDDGLMQAAQDTPTWMSAQAKVGVRYRRAFWREAGASGNAFVSHPQAVLAEIFDACDATGNAAALGGFVALPPPLRESHAASLDLLVRSQLAQLFGPQAEDTDVLVRDWARETFTCSARDAAAPSRHPEDGCEALAVPYWDARLHFGGSETATRGAGYLDGALDAAARIAGRIIAAGAQDGGDAHGRAVNDDAVRQFSVWVDGQRALAPGLYRQGLVQALSAQRTAGLTLSVLLAVMDGVYADALARLEALPFDARGVAVEQGRSALTPRVLAPFDGFSDALLGAALSHNRSSCAMSNFVADHDPDPACLQQIRRELALAWRAFAQTANRVLLDSRSGACVPH